MSWFAICSIWGMLLMTSGLVAQETAELKKGFYPDGSLRYEGKFENEVPVGKMTRYYPNGQVQAELFHEGERTRAVLYSKDGETSSAGVYLNRKKEGEWVYKKDGRLLVTENYKSGILDGVVRRYFLSGKLAEEKNWKAGVPDGEWKTYYPEGGIRLEAFYIQGKLEGKMKGYSPDGVVMAEGTYRNARREGVWRYYDAQGQVKRECSYRAGVAENPEEEELQASRLLEEWIEKGEKIADPAHFTEDPEMYLRMVGD